MQLFSRAGLGHRNEILSSRMRGIAFSWMGVGSLKPMSSSALKNCLLSFSASKPMPSKVLPNVSCGMPKAR